MIDLPCLQRSLFALPLFALPLFALPLLLVTGCAGLMMSVDERSGSNANVTLAPGAVVAVSSPTVANGLDGVVSESFGSGAEFALDLQKAMIAALVANGVPAVAGDSAAGGTLAIHITEFSSGSGAARVWLSGSGVGDSALEGEASLIPPQASGCSSSARRAPCQAPAKVATRPGTTSPTSSQPWPTRS
ncbi:MAG: hypothetical protein ACI9EF_003228 [Pseudohongiellaceae bacterium]|jgi:hypothetical protein